MESDKQFYELFQSNPEFLSDLLNLGVRDYHFTSENYKGIRREVDGVYSHPGKQQAWVIEFHGYPKKKKEMDIYTATFAGMVFFKRKHQDKDVTGIIIFLDPAHDPKVKPWQEIREANLACFQVYYLEELLRQLADRDPQHLLLDVFFPFLVDSREQLAREVPRRYQRILNAPLPPQNRHGAELVFTSWLLARLGDEQEVQDMLAKMIPLEDSPAAEYFRKQGRRQIQEQLEQSEAERRRVEEEKHQVVEANRRMEEANRRMEEDKHQVEEDKRRMEEDYRRMQKELAELKKKLSNLEDPK